MGRSECIRGLYKSSPECSPPHFLLLWWLFTHAGRKDRTLKDCRVASVEAIHKKVWENVEAIHEKRFFGKLFHIPLCIKNTAHSIFGNMIDEIYQKIASDCNIQIRCWYAMIMINQYLGWTVLPKKDIVLLQKMPKIQTFSRMASHSLIKDFAGLGWTRNQGRELYYSPEKKKGRYSLIF